MTNVAEAKNTRQARPKTTSCSNSPPSYSCTGSTSDSEPDGDGEGEGDEGGDDGGGADADESTE